MELPNLIKDLALILIVAGITTLIFKRLKQPLVLGYLVAGFLVSPHMPYIMSVVDKSDIKTWADIGVMFLLFSLGLDFSFKKIVKMGKAPIIASMSCMFFMIMLGMIIGHSFGWSRMNCIFLGGMLAMSSDTIVYKAFDDLGVLHQRFSSLVMSVLIIEDILACVMMVMLSAMGAESSPDGGMMLGSLIKIGFFLILWFVVGIFIIPLFLRKMRPLMNNETMLVVALGLCCLMAVISSQVGVSSAFGAFVMGSILAETMEADKIIKIVEPVKNLFGAIFFVSVGMLVNPSTLIAYALPIAVMVLAVVLGQSIFGTFSFMLSGQPLKTAMRCGFSMAQIGEFAFIIASLGMSLGVISDFLYPSVVAVSAITTFLTPYMIRISKPSYDMLEKRLPKRWVRSLNHLGTGSQSTEEEMSDWRRLIRKMTINVVVYTILCIAIIAIMLTFFLPFIRHILPHWWANGVCGVLCVALMSPFMRSLVMKNLHSDEFVSLWTKSRINRLPLLFTILLRVAIAASLLFYVCNYLARFANAIVITLAIVTIILMALSRWLKHRSIRLERMFIQNLNYREIEEQGARPKRPIYEGNLLDRDIHIADLTIPAESLWVGHPLKALRIRNRFGVHVAAVQRGSIKLNIPNGETILLPADRLQVIGNDEQLQEMGRALRSEVVAEDIPSRRQEMMLRKIILGNKSAFIGKNIQESGIRNIYNCMVVGVEEGQPNLTMISPNRQLEAGDIVWVVGEKDSLDRLTKAMKTS